jgi:hypothetical protein
MPNPGAKCVPTVCLVWLSLATLGALGCAGPQLNLISYKARVAEAGVVFAIDGAGNFQGSSKTIRALGERDHLPQQIVTVEWSHGFGRIIADQIGYAHARAQGEHLAQIVCQFEAEHPGVPVYLTAHSAGSAVLITALENLPPNSVEHAFLLAPSLSAAYDVRPALLAVKLGLHVFYSRRDTAYLGVWTGILGNSDRHWGPSSGRIGFQCAPTCSEDASLYAKLYQRAWEPSDRAAGNDGKHYGDYQPDFVRLHIVPFLSKPPG